MQEEQEQQVTPPVVTPTEAPETAPPAEPTAKPTAAPTQKPTEQSATPKSDAFGAYLQTLEKAQSELDLYNKSYGGSTRQIALSSLYGDNTPEPIQRHHRLGQREHHHLEQGGLVHRAADFHHRGFRAHDYPGGHHAHLVLY